ncbi:hypothetical protein D3C75_1388000 [compost metagenome]
MESLGNRLTIQDIFTNYMNVDIAKVQAIIDRRTDHQATDLMPGAEEIVFDDLNFE